MLKLFIAGQKSFGAAVYKAVRNAGHSVTGVACPADGQYYDRLKKAAYCDKSKPVIIDSDKLRSFDIPDSRGNRCHNCGSQPPFHKHESPFKG